MSQTIQQKQIEYFTMYAGSCLKTWNSIVGQQITHCRFGLGTIVGMKTIDNIYVEVQFMEIQGPKQEPKRFLGTRGNMSKEFTHLTLPREVENELEERFWNFIKDKAMRTYGLDMVDKPFIFRTFNIV